MVVVNIDCHDNRLLLQDACRMAEQSFLNEGVVIMRVFIIAHKSEDFTTEDFAAHLKAEEDHCLELYADGTLREILRRDDGKGAVLILEVENVAQAQQICADLPYAKLGMLSFSIYGTLPGLWPLIPKARD